jgi:uncharacterized repeat protein (TIGR01451 family)
MAGARSWLVRRCVPAVSVALLAASGAAVTPNAAAASATTTSVKAAAPTAPGSSGVTPVVAKADLKLAIVATALVAGTQATYTISVVNVGPKPANTVTLTDTLPLGFTLVSSTGSTFDACTATTPTPTTPSKVTCTAPVDLAVGTSTIALTVLIDAGAPSSGTGTVANSATVKSQITADPIPANNTATLTSNLVSRSDLAIGLSHPGGFTAKQQAGYTITVTNKGPSAAAPGTTVTDTLPAGVTYVSSAGPNWTCALNQSGQIVCTLGQSLAVNAKAPVTLAVAVGPTAASFVINRATVSTKAPTIDPNTKNNAAADPTAVPASLPSGGASDPGACGAPSGTTPPVRTCNLVAATGWLTLPTGALPIWGFAIDNGSPASVPGVTLVAVEGETVVLNVRNALPVGADQNNLSVVLPGVATSSPDSKGVPSGGTKSYTLTGLKPGTYVYEAGPTVNGARQVGMGLSGLLIVRPKSFTNSGPGRTLFNDPAPGGTACNTAGASTTFTAETMLVVNEFNSQFNNNPLNSSLNDYAPDIFLIDGQAYPSTPVIPVGTGDCLLVHLADLGLREHSVGFLNLRQTILANDSVPVVYPQNLAANYLNPGQEADAAVSIVPAAQPGALFPFLDFGRHLHNGAGQPASTTGNTGMKLGGMLALVKVVGTPVPVTNPTTDTVSAAPVTNNGTQTITVTATSTAHNGSANIAAAEWSIDAIASAGSGTAATPFPAPASPSTYAISIPACTPILVAGCAPLSTLEDGDHIVWVRTQDSTGTWADPPVGVVFTLSKKGPSVYALAGDPGTVDGQGNLEAITNASRSVPNKQPFLLGDPNAPTQPTDLIITGTAEPALADWTIGGAEYCIDATTCNGTNPMKFGVTNLGVFGPPAPGLPAAIGAAIPVNVVSALSSGTHTVYVRATEVPPSGVTVSARPGPWTSIALVVLNTGPTAAIASVTPDPAGLYANHDGNLNYQPSVRLNGTLTTAIADAMVADGELFFGNTTDPDPGSPGGQQFGQGTELTPAGGIWGKANALAVYGDIPVADFTAFAEGKIRVWINGKDSAGNWGPVVHYDLTLDKTIPLILDKSSGATTDPVVITTGTTYSLDFWAQDPATAPANVTSNLVAVEWKISYPGVIDQPNVNLFTSYLSSPSNGPVEINFDISGGPQPYPAGALVIYHVRDGAGNWSSYRQTLIH